MEHTDVNQEDLLNAIEVIKLERNSRGCNWSIKIKAEGVFLSEADIARLKDLHEQMDQNFGRPEGQ